MPQMTVSTRITLMFEATLCFVRRRETDINPLFLPWTDKSMEWRCHTLRQCRGQFGFDGPAKALLLPVTVRALQIGNPEEIICEEHVYQCCRIQPSQRGEIREKARKQTALYKTKVIQSLEQNITENFSEQIFQFSQEMLPGDYDIAQVNTLCHSAVCQECVLHVSLVFKRKLSIALTSAWMLSFTRVFIRTCGANCITWRNLTWSDATIDYVY